MVQKLIFSVCLISFLLCTSCSSLENDIDVSAADSVADWSTNDYDALNLQFAAPVMQSGMTRFSWESPDKIEPECFSDYYAFLDQLGEVKIDYNQADDSGVVYIAAKDFEEAVQNHFEIGADLLRKSSYYDAHRNAYQIYGVGGAADTRVVNAELSGNMLAIDFESFMGDELGQQGTIVLELGSDNQYIYRSCQRTDK